MSDDDGRFMLPTLSSPKSARSVSCPPVSPQRSLEMFLERSFPQQKTKAGTQDVRSSDQQVSPHVAMNLNENPSQRPDATVQILQADHSISSVLRSPKRLAREWKTTYAQIVEEEDDMFFEGVSMMPRKFEGGSFTQTEKLSRQTASLILRRLQVQLDESKKSSSQQDETIARHRREISELVRECRRLERERDADRAELAHAKTEIQNVMEELTEVKGSKSVTQGNLKYAREQNKALKAEMSAKEKELLKAEEKLELQRGQQADVMDDLEDALADARSQIRVLEKKLDKYKEQRVKTGQKVSESKQLINERLADMATSPIASSGGLSRPMSADYAKQHAINRERSNAVDDDSESDEEARERERQERQEQRNREREEKRRAEEQEAERQRQAAARAPFLPQDSVMSMSSDVGEFQEILERLKELQLQLDESSAELAQSKTEVQGLQEAKAGLEALLEQEKEQRDRRIIDLTGEVNKLKEQLASLTEKHKQVEEEKARAEQEAQDLRAENQMLNGQLEDEKKEVVKLKMANDKHAVNLDKERHESANLRMQVNHLNETLMKLKDKEEKLQRELTFNKERVAAIDQKYQDIKQTLLMQERIIKTFEEGQRSEMEVHILNELHTLQTSVERKERAFERAQKEAEQKIEALEHTAMSSAQEAERATGQLLETTKSLAKTKNDLEEIREKYNYAEEERRRLEVLSKEQGDAIQEVSNERDKLRITLEKQEGLRLSEKVDKLEQDLDLKSRQLEEALELSSTLQEHLEGVRSMWEKEQLLRKNVRKLLLASDAIEGCLTCMVCTNMLDDPVTLGPCGHNICRNCWLSHKSDAAKGRWCPECGRGMVVASVVANKTISTVIGNLTYQYQVLETLKSGHDDFLKISRGEMKSGL